MRRGLFGGSFDPVHYGHLLLAETCREVCQLDEVWLTPAAKPPHKLGQSQAAPRQRLEMVRLAVEDAPGLVASALEIDRAGVSFTVDTLAVMQAQDPQAELFLLVGGDSLRDFLSWREPQQIARLATLVVVRRGGQSREDVQRWRCELQQSLGAAARCVLVDMPTIELSSSGLRERVAAGQSIRFRTPRAVEQYIQSHQLYRSSGGSS